MNGDGFVNRAFDRDGGEEETRLNGAVGVSASSAAGDKAKSVETPRVDIGDSVSKCIVIVTYLQRDRPMCEYLKMNRKPTYEIRSNTNELIWRCDIC